MLARLQWGERVARRVERQRRLQEYYEGTTYGVSSAVLVGHLVGELGRGSNTFLWLSCLGLTDQYLHDKISTYVKLQTLCSFRFFSIM